MASPGGTEPSAGAPRSQATLASVAAAAGVSRSTVSRVVNHAPNVRPDIVAAVNAAILRLNYVPNRGGRAPRGVNAVALLVPEEITRFFGDPYLALVVKGIMSRLDRSDHLLTLVAAGGDGGEKTSRYLQHGIVDGALVVTQHPAHHGLASLNSAVPLVFGGRPSVPGLGPGYYVDVDNIGGARAATAHLVDRGCRSIGTITGPDNVPASRDRIAGWQRALNDAGRAAGPVAHGDFTVMGGVAGMIELLDHQPDLDGVFAANDLMARGALSVLSRRRITVPDEVAVVGFDDGPAAIGEQPRLTTVRQPAVELGEAMAGLLLDLIAGRTPPAPIVLLPTQLIVRDTA
jgi:LacI family transcriptional regulator